MKKQLILDTWLDKKKKKSFINDKDFINLENDKIENEYETESKPSTSQIIVFYFVLNFVTKFN